MHQYLYAEEWFKERYPFSVRAPAGSPYDFASGVLQIEVKGIAVKVSDGGDLRREGRAFINVEKHAHFGLLPNPYYCFVAYNGECIPHFLTWIQVDTLIRSYKTFTRRAPDGRVAVKIALHKIIEADSIIMKVPKCMDTD
jgi:hypothetical protein